MSSSPKFVLGISPRLSRGASITSDGITNTTTQPNTIQISQPTFQGVPLGQITASTPTPPALQLESPAVANFSSQQQQSPSIDQQVIDQQLQQQQQQLLLQQQQQLLLLQQQQQQLQHQQQLLLLQQQQQQLQQLAIQQTQQQPHQEQSQQNFSSPMNVPSSHSFIEIQHPADDDDHAPSSYFDNVIDDDLENIPPPPPSTIDDNPDWISHASPSFGLGNADSSSSIAVATHPGFGSPGTQKSDSTSNLGFNNTQFPNNLQRADSTTSMSSTDANSSHLHQSSSDLMFEASPFSTPIQSPEVRTSYMTQLQNQSPMNSGSAGAVNNFGLSQSTPSFPTNGFGSHETQSIPTPSSFTNPTSMTPPLNIGSPINSTISSSPITSPTLSALSGIQPSGLTASGSIPVGEEGGSVRPDDPTTFVPIVPQKKDYSVQNAIKDKVVDDLVFFSRNFQIIIKGGTLLKLIERLTFESTTDNDYIDTFLLTYRNFISPTELLESMLNRYATGAADINQEELSEIELSNAEKKQKIIRIRVGNVLKRWLTDHYHDFHDPALLARLEKGIEDIQEAQLQGTLRKTIQEQQLSKNKIRDLMFSKEKPPSILPKGPTFDDWDVVEVARQVCLYEQSIYQTIHPKEALGQAWNKHKDRAPNIIKMISFFNRFSKWVSTQICNRENFKERVKILKKFMQLTIQLREYNNFDSMQAVLSGLNNSSVFRLKASWAKVQKDKLYNQWKTMADHITDTTNNSHNYRTAVSHADPPIIPYLGVYLTDLTFTEDGNPNYLRVQGGREDIINFEKMRRVAVVIKDICTYQQTPYNFDKVPMIYDFFAGDLPYEDDNTLFKKSRVLEPPDPNSPGNVITPKKPKKTLSFRRVSLGMFSSKDKDESSPPASPSSSSSGKKLKDKKNSFVKDK